MSKKTYTPQSNGYLGMGMVELSGEFDPETGIVGFDPDGRVLHLSAERVPMTFEELQADAVEQFGAIMAGEAL